MIIKIQNTLSLENNNNLTSKSLLQKYNGNWNVIKHKE